MVLDDFIFLDEDGSIDLLAIIRVLHLLDDTCDSLRKQIRVLQDYVFGSVSNEDDLDG